VFLYIGRKCEAALDVPTRVLMPATGKPVSTMCITPPRIITCHTAAIMIMPTDSHLDSSYVTLEVKCKVPISLQKRISQLVEAGTIFFVWNGFAAVHAQSPMRSAFVKLSGTRSVAYFWPSMRNQQEVRKTTVGLYCVTSITETKKMTGFTRLASKCLIKVAIW